MTSPEAQQAFDIHGEPDKMRERYGRNAFGQRALLARRLVEAGVPFVTLYDGGWDHHSDIFGAIAKQLPPFENAIATLIEDLEERGLLETTLVVALGEFGRTPKISTLPDQKKAGARSLGQRHVDPVRRLRHAGGPGCRRHRSQRSCRRRADPLAGEFRVDRLRKLGIDPGKIYYAPNGRPAHLVSDPTPIKELMG